MALIQGEPIIIKSLDHDSYLFIDPIDSNLKYGATKGEATPFVVKKAQAPTYNERPEVEYDAWVHFDLYKSTAGLGFKFSDEVYLEPRGSDYNGFFSIHGEKGDILLGQRVVVGNGGESSPFYWVTDTITNQIMFLKDETQEYFQFESFEGDYDPPVIDPPSDDDDDDDDGDDDSDDGDDDNDDTSSKWSFENYFRLLTSGDPLTIGITAIIVLLILIVIAKAVKG